jgi:hypothetical protein
VASRLRHHRHNLAPQPATTINLLSVPDRASALAGAARERMLSMFQLDRMVDETLAVYGEVELS